MVFRSQSVADIVRRINTQLVLPPWKTELRCSQAQVMLLFDRLMVEHSLGTFHFWEADQQNRARWPLYRFRLFQRPEEESPMSVPDHDIHLVEPLSLVLDGKQRLEALFLGLKGAFIADEDATGVIVKPWSRFHHLHIDLFYFWDRGEEPDPLPNEVEFTPFHLTKLTYRWEFRTDAPRDKSQHWFPIRRMLKCTSAKQFWRMMDEEHEATASAATDDQRYILECNLQNLYDALCCSKAVVSYVERSQDYNKVLQRMLLVSNAGMCETATQLRRSISTLKSRYAPR